jgi:chromosome segregation ATPase
MRLISRKDKQISELERQVRALIGQRDKFNTANDELRATLRSERARFKTSLDLNETLRIKLGWTIQDIETLVESNLRELDSRLEELGTASSASFLMSKAKEETDRQLAEMSNSFHQSSKEVHERDIIIALLEKTNQNAMDELQVLKVKAQGTENELQDAKGELQRKECKLRETTNKLQTIIVKLQDAEDMSQKREIVLQETIAKLEETTSELLKTINKLQDAENTFNTKATELQQTTVKLQDAEDILQTKDIELQQMTVKLQGTTEELQGIKTMLQTKETELQETKIELQEVEDSRRLKEEVAETLETTLWKSIVLINEDKIKAPAKQLRATYDEMFHNHEETARNKEALSVKMGSPEHKILLTDFFNRLCPRSETHKVNSTLALFPCYYFTKSKPLEGGSKKIC